ncbi:hypothetical protein ASPACDRAFT_1859509 [Aspergillus aculeatus ATCC 16872]|uniref:Uncharacterized protein n=1 Tax=Aspergillus aculeatus (strain ATCC 16872 / CBS 172.66 / WB 5094) TaxID=690307 RepID=A0A1L9WJC7_ASPA1|nr:uncharacterized protein ASPACDRAFT_1859509 [Aspergillus aculeatus ATCC 16872]OJJ96258.1 hypothetical protein ASPACDRAFT_1859509 [Aspergillus aculeatus ATCC 16872]
MMNLSPPHPRPFFKSHPHINPASLKKPSRWYLPLMAAIALGFGAYNHYTAPAPATTTTTTTKALQNQHLYQQQEEERLRKNRALMDAYGDKETLQDIERALVVYDLQ